MATRSLHLPIVIDILEPCSEAWDSLLGDERVRHCERCTKHVHNLSELTEDEIVDVVSREHVCISLQIDAGGALVSADSKRSPAGRASRVLIAAALTALAACGKTEQRPVGFNRTGGSPPVSTALLGGEPTALSPSATPPTGAAPSASAAAHPVPSAAPSAGRLAPLRLGGAPPILRRPDPHRTTGVMLQSKPPPERDPMR